jgi:hypothetical protein
MPYTNDEMGVEQFAPQVERNVTPVEETAPKTETVNKAGANDDRTALKKIVEEHEKDLQGKAYDLCCEALAENDPVKITEMLNRSIVYLGKKGIKVA